MNEKEIREIIECVVERYKKATEPTQAESIDKSIFTEASARHVHLTQSDVEKLFGEGEELCPVRELSQPGQFLSDKRVRLVTKKGSIENVAVLGPVRPETQVELSATDCRGLGITAPVRMSGELDSAADVYIFADKGEILAKGSVIIAKSHIHMTSDDAKRFGVTDRQTVRVRIESERPVTFENVTVRVNDNFSLAMHIDFDEANACMLSKDTKAYIIS